MLGGGDVFVSGKITPKLICGLVYFYTYFGTAKTTFTSLVKAEFSYCTEIKSTAREKAREQVMSEWQSKVG